MHVATKCIGCAICESICPSVFKMAEDGYARVYVDRVPLTSRLACREAVDACPVDAILGGSTLWVV